MEAGCFTRVVTVEMDGKPFLRVDKMNRHAECKRVASEAPKGIGHRSQVATD